MFDWVVKSKSFNLQELKSNILRSKNIDSFEEFINPKDPIKYINDFPSDFIENVKIGKEIILTSIKENLPIVIHGDYDADGVISTYIIYSTIKDFLNYQNVFYLIPDRFEDGYGLSDKTVKKILEMVDNQNFLLITVDCGITSISQVEYLKSLGNKIIVTDHHHQGDKAPNADSLIWSDKVVGSTLSWVLALSLGNKDTKLISLIATATVTDVFPLREFNRSVVKKGLEILKKNSFYPFKKLLEFQNVKLDDLSVYHLGFVIGPRLNSSGRVADADLSVSLLNSKNDEELNRILQDINMVNQRRQKLTEDSLGKFSLEKQNLPKIIIVKDEDFHEGIVGLIASRIVQTYHRPALIITKSEDCYKGSARSIKGINIIKIIKKFQHRLKGCGGHELAAGFSLSAENFDDFKKEIEDYIDINFDDSCFIKKIQIDSEIPPSLIDDELDSFIQLLSPYGQENEEPIFLTKNLKVMEIKKMGNEKKHLSLKIGDGISFFKALYFNYPEDALKNYLGQQIDVVYKIRKNIFNNQTNLDLHILDMKESG